MKRKEFIKKAGVGLGCIVVPSKVKRSSTRSEKEYAAGLDPKVIKDGEGEVFNVLGDIQTHKILGSDTDNQIVEWVDDVSPGVGIPPHVHTKEDEIFRVIKGKVEIMVNGKTSTLNAGDIAFAPKNVPHAWTVVGTEPAKMITSAFPAGIEKMFEELATLPAGPPDFEKVFQICGDYGISFLEGNK